MNIAICLSGEIRTWKNCYQSIYDAFPNSNIDIYATIWSRDFNELESLTNLTKYVEVVKENDERLLKLYEFEKIILENFFSSHQKNKIISTMKPLPIFMFTRRELMAKISYDMIDKNYDYIIRSRYDHKYISNIEQKLDRKLMLTEDWGGSAPNDLVDRYRAVYDGFAAGPPDIMQEYYDIHKWIAKYHRYSSEKVLKAEAAMGLYINKVKKLPVKYVKNILAIQLNDKQFCNRSNVASLNPSYNQKERSKQTLKSYKYYLKKYHNDIYDKYKIEDVINEF